MTEPINRSAWTLRRRVTALFLLVGVVLVFLAAGAVTTAVANRGQLDRLIDDIGPMRTAANGLTTALVNQETAVRGYALNNAADNLALYDEAQQDQKDQITAIVSSRAVTAEVRQDVDQITALSDAWRATVAAPAIAAAGRGDAAAAASLLGDSARTQFNGIRAALNTLQQALQALRDDSVISIKDTSSTLLFVLIAVSALVIASGIGLLVSLQRSVTGPVTDLAAQVRAVARGHYDHDITTSGPPELTRLASDVDSMRRQIASDLAEVESARREIEEANRRLEQQADELLRSNRDLEQFAYVASHDLQEPLRKVASFCQLLQRRYEGQLDERADQYIAFAVSGAQRMQRLINDLLAFSRIGRNTAAFTEVDLDQVASSAVNQLDASLASTGAEVTWSELPVVSGEETLLGTLFTNLIANAVKFRRPDVPCRIQLSAQRIGDTYEFGCVDNGIGIEAEFADKVFVIFQRLHPRDAYPGTGIGLAIAKKIVEYHGGTIWVDTAHTGGAAIRFSLPVVAEPVADPSTPTVTGEQSVSAPPAPEQSRREREPVA